MTGDPDDEPSDMVGSGPVRWIADLRKAEAERDALAKHVADLEARCDKYAKTLAVIYGGQP